MRRFNFSNQHYDIPNYNTINEERFLGPIIPFLGGAAIGYIAGRPQYNYSYPAYYPVYYPYYSDYYPQQPNIVQTPYR